MNPMDSKRGPTSIGSQREKAEAFRALHHANRMLVLPNAWDVASSRVFEDEGFAAIATSSAALAVSVGYPDGEKIPKEELFVVVRRIARALTVPLSVDLESGYGVNSEEVTDTIRRLVESGAVGLNIEDTIRLGGKSLRPLEEQVDRIRTVRKASDALEMPIVINARTDAYLIGGGDPRVRLEEAIRRGNAFEAAGADCLYPMGLADRDTISAFVKHVDKPVNVMVRQGTPPISELERLGVRRLSLGPGPMYAAMGLLRRIASELREKGTYDALRSGAITFDELMGLAIPKQR